MNVVTSFRFPLLACLALAGVCLPVKAFQPAGEAKVLPDVLGFLPQFGYAAAMSGDTVVIGAPTDFANAGAAYVFVRSGTIWTQQATLTASDAETNAKFGNAVAIDGDTIVVGAPGPDDGTGTSAAYIFVRQAGAWSQQAKLVPAGTTGNQQFGSAVDLSGDSAAIGAILDADAGFNAGAVYVFGRSATTWSQQAKLFAQTPSVGDLFGFSVSLDGDTLAAGAPYADKGITVDTGAVNVFHRGVTGWQVEAVLSVANPGLSDRLGWSVALSGDTLIGGAPGRYGRGAAYAFSRSGSSWNPSAEFSPASTDSDQLFGYSLGLDGSELVIGCPFDNTYATIGGAAYFYHSAGASWVLDGFVSASDVAEEDQIGFAVALDGRQAVISSPFKNGMIGFDQGSAYIYSATANTPPQADAKSVVTDQDVPVGVTLTGSDPEDQPLTFAVATPPVRGNLSGTPPNLTYTPDPAVSGSDSFTYVAHDGEIESAPATVTITILPAKAPPVADSQSVITDEDAALGIALTGSSSDGSPLTYAVVSAPSSGTLSGTPPQLVYTPAPNFNGSDSFTFRVIDANLVSEPASVNITVNPVNDPPTIDPIPTQTGTAGNPVGPIAIKVDDIDDDAGALQITGESDNQELVPDTALQFSGTGTQRWLTINLPSQQTGTATIFVTVRDARSSSTTGFLLIVQTGNQPPIADASATPRLFITSASTGALVTLDGSRSSDADGDPLTYVWSVNGTVAAQGVVTSTILPAGAHTVTLTVSDGSATATDTLQVEVVDVVDAINQLIEAIRTSSLPDSVKTELIASLRNAAKRAAKEDFIPTDKMLAAFENKVAAQSGKKIPPAQAEFLLEASAAIRAALP